MSDEFSQCCARFKNAISVTQPEIRYEAMEREKRIIFTLGIPYPLMREWHKIVQEEEIACSKRTSGENSSTGSDIQSTNSSSTSAAENQLSTPPSAKRFSYIELVEKCTLGEFFAFSDDENVRKEIDSALLKIAYKISLEYKNTRGRARKQLDDRVRKFHVMEGQTKSVQELYQEIESLQDELQEWKLKYKNLEVEKERIYEEMVLAVKQAESATQGLQETNKELEDYIASLEKSVGIGLYQGKPLSAVKNKSRTLKTFLSRAQTALWFCSSFGIELQSLTVKESDSNEIHNITSQPNCHDSENQGDGESKYSTLPECEKKNVEQILFLLDKFCVGDTFYHELSMITDGLPRSYLVKQCCDQLKCVTLTH